MKEVLLKELTNSDINWMITTGLQREIAAGTVLIQEGKTTDTLHLVLDGTLVVTTSQADNNPLGRAFAAIEGDEIKDREIAKLSSGEIVGEIPFINVRTTAASVRAIEKSLVISIPQQELAVKLQRDVGFACRFYRAIAILLSDRITQLGRSKLVQSEALRDMLFVLGELNDSDIDWMIATGTRQKIAAHTVLIREGGPVDALYILLDGMMTVSISEDRRNPLIRAFAAMEGTETQSREIARLSRGEIVGETPFIDTKLPPATVQAIADSLVLSIKRQQLAAKLQQDIGFASRFYRVIATLLSNRLHELLSRIVYGRRVYSKGQPLDENIEYEDELDSIILDRMALAGTRFDWMLKRLKVV
ncbi:MULTISPECIES: cyclic nucleotide-binding domain-containing protein [unclassified Nostoc]|uniref:cyclic nucleotide-binding domain-containing protein n=1 Tax=unclassified Nostoc TaxID=2593658 RepID=UPI002AD3D67B|nr:cyclic nucleotide-binding domain-containing protein [Nostoc sp. DedQUE03]MDZ7971113.1 cyclic nucleotide-binding domain-containing protein [Nostoc sp. DedQUE03]MDZ8046731.1 cyclic nucleotide-binding domain-containing protein [Nostoc sp. DedQUE02]